MTTLSTRLTSGVHLLMAPYMGMFIPWRAERLRVAWRPKQSDAGRNARPERNVYAGREVRCPDRRHRSSSTTVTVI